MKSLRRICFCGPLAVVLLAGFLAAYPRPAAKGSGITKANFDRIVEGMTQQDVEGIFGCPPGNYTNGQAFSGISMKYRMKYEGIRREFWTGYGGDIEVAFSKEDGKVVAKHCMETEIILKPTWLDRIKGLFKDVFSARS